MKSNPYQGTTATSETRSTRWMFVVGVVALVLSTICLHVAVAGMIAVFQLLADSVVQPHELASGILIPLGFSFATLPLGFIGFVFLILGFKNQQPAPTA